MAAPQASAGSDRRLRSIVEAIGGVADDDTVTLGDLLEAVGTRSLGPLLLLPALLAASPAGGVPGVPTLLAMLILLVVTYWFLSGDQLWLPGFIRRREVSSDLVQKSVRVLRPVASWTDRHFGDHWTGLVRPSSEKAVALAAALMALVMPPLELVPFAVTLPAGAIALMALGLTLRDGVLLAAGFAVSIAAPLAAGWFLL